MSKMNIGVEASSWINIVAGIALAVVAWYQTTELAAAFWNGALAGLVLVMLGAWTAYDAARNEGRNSSWVGGASILTGAYIFAYPWFVYVVDAYFWTALTIGGVVALVSAYETYAAVSGRSSRRVRPMA